MLKTLAKFAARCIAGVFFWVSASSACDGVSPTCPASSEQALRYKFSGTGVTASDYIYSTFAQAADAWCSAKSAALGDAIISCPDQIRSGYIIDGLFARPGGSYYQTGYVYSSTVPVYTCNSSQYPTGPDSNNNCHLTICKAGQRFNSWSSDDGSEGAYYSGPEGASSYCNGFPVASGVVESCSVVPSSGGICGSDGRCLFDSVTMNGQRCSAPDSDAEGGSGNPCQTYGDGHSACDSDASSDQEHSAPGNNGTGSRCVNFGGRQYCIDVTPPNDNCASNPSLPECQSPVEQNCSFVGGRYYCSDADNSCGTFNGVSLCICDDGSVQAPGGACSDIPEGSGPGTPGDGTGAGNSDAGEIVDGLTEAQPAEGDYKLNGTFSHPELDSFINGIGQEYNHGIESSGAGMFNLPSGSCAPYQFTLPKAGLISIDVPCNYLGWVKSILEWLLTAGMVFFTWKRFRETI